MNDKGIPAIPASFFQCRVTVPNGKKYPDTNYDSTLIFPVEDMAAKYTDVFVEQLQELEILGPKAKYVTKIVQLGTYLPEVLSGEKRD